jgi:hypothetical protein
MLSEDTKAWHSKLCDMSQEEIVTLMEDENIKAEPRNSKSCAIVVFIHQKTGQKVAVGGTCMGLPLDQWNGEDYAYLPHSDSLHDFVVAFDQGEYPQLVKS